MRNDKKEAIALRKLGLSYNAIYKKLGIPKGTISEWFSELPWSQDLKKNLTQKAFIKTYPKLQAMNNVRSRFWEKWREKARQEALGEFKKNYLDPLFIAGVIIYWGEGDKKPENPVRVSNVDPEMLRIFTKFLRRHCGLDDKKIKARLTLYPDLDETICKNYWLAHVNIKSNFFNKTQIITGRHKTKKLHYGICTVTISSRQLKEKLLIWIKEFSRKL